MASGREKRDEQTEEKVQASTPQLDQLERLAKAAAATAQARRWRARKDGLQEQVETSQVRSLNHDAEARAQAEAAMQQMMAKSNGKNRRAR